MAKKSIPKASTSQKKQANNSSSHDHPDHSIHLPRLRRVKGQLEGIERMITDGRYCPDIITQLKAAASALKAIEAEVFKAHLRGCVHRAISDNNPLHSEEKIQEIIKLVY